MIIGDVVDVNQNTRVTSVLIDKDLVLEIKGVYQFAETISFSEEDILTKNLLNKGISRDIVSQMFMANSYQDRNW
jgi:hypothetical protein